MEEERLQLNSTPSRYCKHGDEGRGEFALHKPIPRLDEGVKTKHLSSTTIMEPGFTGYEDKTLA